MEKSLIAVGPLDFARDVDGLCRASQLEFGSEGYQHMGRYLEWLYRRNPAGRGTADCLIARQDDAVVGCMHRLMLPLRSREGDLLAVLHNHFVAEAVRSGPGVLLLRRAVKDVAAGFAPGVQAPLDQVYRRLAFVEHQGAWLMRPLAPIRAAVQLAAGRVRASAPLRIDMDDVQKRCPEMLVTATPDDAMVDRLCEAMRRDQADAVSVDWTRALVRWRYFDPAGPRHLMALCRDSGGMAVIALGRRRGLAVARLLELTQVDGRALARVVRVMRAAGAVLALTFTTKEAVAEQAMRAGWRRRDNGTFSFRTPTVPLVLGAGASDVGFEAFRTEIR